jgi:hypothetical protein
LVVLCACPASALTLVFDQGDFTAVTPVFSNVVTFNFNIRLGVPLQAGTLYADPVIDQIEYNVSGDLEMGTPSGFPSFVFQLSHLIAPPPAPPTSISGALFYSLNPSAVAGQTVRFQVAAGADLSDGLQIAELVDLGGGVVFRIDGREEGTGRYHPMVIELRADGTGRIQNADNMGGENPITMEVVDVMVGEEYVTDLAFDPATFTIGIPEPSLVALLGCAAVALRRGARSRTTGLGSGVDGSGIHAMPSAPLGVGRRSALRAARGPGTTTPR